MAKKLIDQPILLDPYDPEDAHEILLFRNFKSTLIKTIKECDKGSKIVPTKDILSDIAKRREFAGALLNEFVKRATALINVKKYEGEKDYSTTLAEIGKITDNSLSAVISPIHMYEDLESYSATLKLFTSTKYVTPGDVFSLRRHLETIFLFYCLCEAIPLMSYNLLLKIDYALAKLSRHSSLFESLLDKKGFHVDRVMSSKKLMQSKKADRAQAVIEEYYKIKNKDELSKNRIATLIQDRLEQKGIKSPVPNTIIKYLQKDPEIKRF